MGEFWPRTPHTTQDLRLLVSGDLNITLWNTGSECSLFESMSKGTSHPGFFVWFHTHGRTDNPTGSWKLIWVRINEETLWETLMWWFDYKMASIGSQRVVLLGNVGLMEEVCHRGWTWGFRSPSQARCHSLFLLPAHLNVELTATSSVPCFLPWWQWTKALNYKLAAVISFIRVSMFIVSLHGNRKPD